MSPLLTGFPFVAGGGVQKATVTGTTGSPTIDTSSRPGKTIYKFTGSGTITIGVGGTCEFLIIGGASSNGAGGYVYRTNYSLPAGTATVTVGAGTAATSIPNQAPASQLGDFIAFGGSSTGSYQQSGYATAQGGSTGGNSGSSYSVAQPVFNGLQGNAGALGVNGTMGPSSVGGGGGAGGAGSAAPTLQTGGNGGAGAANSITGTSVTYAAGGGGYGTVTNGSPTGSGAANTGNGGGSGGTGGSGFVVVVIG